MANVIAGLATQLSMDTTEFQKGISEAKKSMKEFAEYIPEALSIAGFIEATKSAMEFSNKIVETAKANEVAVSSVMELSKALEENGGSADKVGTIYSGFTNKLESAVAGSAKAQEAFSRAGISLHDLATLSEQDLFEKTINGLAKMTDSAERNGLAFQTLGKAVKGVDIVGLAQTLEETKGTMDKYAGAVTMAHELSLKLEASSRQLSLSFTEAVIPSLSKLYNAFSQTSPVMQFFFDIVRATAQVLAIMIKDTATLVEVLVKQVVMLAKVAGDVASLDFTKAMQDYKDTQAEVTKMFEDDAKFQKDILANQIQINDKTKENVNAHREVIASNAKQIGQIEGIADAYANQLKLMNQQREEKEQSNLLTKKEKEVQDAVNKVLDAQTKILDQIAQKKKLAESLPTSQKGGVLKALQDQEDAIKVITDLTVDSEKIRVKAVQDEQNSFSLGWTQAFQQFSENAETYSDIGKKSFTSVSTTMTNALMTFAETGKISFKSLISDMISGLIKLQLQYQTMQIFSSMTGGITGMVASAGGLLGGTQQGPTQSGGNLSSGVFGNLFSGLGFASGGNPPIGQSSLVGENGPELFVPSSAGTIIPNNRIQDYMGGNGGGTTYNGPYIANLSAIDTQSATQFLANNRQAVWSANISAQRSLPQSR